MCIWTRKRKRNKSLLEVITNLGSGVSGKCHCSFQCWTVKITERWGFWIPKEIESIFFEMHLFSMSPVHFKNLISLTSDFFCPKLNRMIVNYNLSRIYSDDWRTHVENTFFFFLSSKGQHILYIFFLQGDIWHLEVWHLTSWRSCTRVDVILPKIVTEVIDFQVHGHIYKVKKKDRCVLVIYPDFIYCFI